MKKFFYKIKAKLLTIFGDIKVYRWPMFIIYAPKTFRVKGFHTRTIMNLIKPGDVLMRSYVDYLDGYFIPKGKSGCSHTGIYVGENNVIHAMAEGIVQHDLIDFCRCDKIILMRPKKNTKSAINAAKKFLKDGIEYDFDFTSGNKALYCHEFTASCYPRLEIKKITQKKFFGLLKATVYLADSFFTNPNFKLVHESKEN